MKMCERCSDPLDSAAKCARSPVCTTCAATKGEVSAIAVIPLLCGFASWEDLDRLCNMLW